MTSGMGSFKGSANLNLLQDLIWSSVQKEFAKTESSEEAVAEAFQHLFSETRKDCTDSFLNEVRLSASKMLSSERRKRRGFEKRTHDRWKPSFDHLETIWRIAQEVGEAHARNFDKTSDLEEVSVHSALSQIFPRALLVSQEILCLLRGGFPDGALARWRSLHELNVTAMYIAKHGRSAADSYLLSFRFAARRAARQVNEYSDRNNIEPISPSELKTLDKDCAAAERHLGRKFANDKDAEWPKINYHHRTFADIERDVCMDHWRPYFKWASSHIHSNHRRPDRILGMSEANEYAHLVGGSNSGFVDPFQMTALSLVQVTSTFLLTNPNVDRLVICDVLTELSNEMASVALENEKETMHAFRSKTAE